MNKTCFVPFCNQTDLKPIKSDNPDNSWYICKRHWREYIRNGFIELTDDEDYENREAEETG